MKIGIDISILSGKFDGIGFYAFKVLEELAKYKEHKIYLYSNVPIKMKLPSGDNYIIRASNMPGHTRWLIRKLKNLLLEDKIEVFWQPNYLLPFKIKGLRTIITVHDLSGYSSFRYVDLKTIIKQRMYLKQSCKKVTVIITDSEYSNNQICKTFKVNEEKVKTIYLSLNSNNTDNEVYSNTNQQKVATFLSYHKIEKEGYYLFVGTLAPRKNDRVLIDGYKEYLKRGGKKRLILAGAVSKKTNKYLQTVLSEYKDDIFSMGYIDENTKSFLYDQAYAVLYPSRLEGFGIPILEAMHHKKIVITSNVTSLPEVGGNAALYLKNINSASELAELMIQSESIDEKTRKMMIREGERRVDYFESLNYPRRIVNVLLNGDYSNER